LAREDVLIRCLASNKRIDILLRDKQDDSLTVVEVKKGQLGREAIKQLKAYISEVKKEFKSNKVHGILVGSSSTWAFPATHFLTDFMHLTCSHLTVHPDRWL